ncbi:MAG: MBL fold metallo-hydrolase [Gemmatimonadales bacterium]|nr:MBL fold metallo-hydrolase [Gemmatimonadales bacterium]
MTPPIRYGETVTLAPSIRRITQQNPGPFTGPGTNTHLIGTSDLLILDPGEARDDGHADRIIAAVGNASVRAVVPSHGHPDHWPLAPQLAERLGAPVMFFGHHAGFRVDRTLADRDTIPLGDALVHVLHTPGHTADHLSFHYPAEGALFPGDTVMAWSSTIIMPPEGNLPDYLASLERMLRLPDLAALYPAHGEAVVDPYGRLQALREHRMMRTRQALDALAEQPDTLEGLVRRIYTDIDPVLYPAAAQSLLAHLLALESAGMVARPNTEAPPSGGARWRRLNDDERATSG